MKLIKLDETGLSHGILLLGFAVIFAVAGVAYLVASQAATASYYTILDYRAAAQTSGVTTVGTNINSLGEQNVSQVAPGAKLTYLIGGKTPLKSVCYLVSVVRTKDSTGAPIKVQFASPTNVKTVRLQTAKTGTINDYQRVCVNNGRLSPKDFNVYNVSAKSGTYLHVYQVQIQH